MLVIAFMCQASADWATTSTPTGKHNLLITVQSMMQGKPEQAAKEAQALRMQQSLRQDEQ